MDSVRASYDALADAYAARYNDELRHKPLDRALLAAFADETRALQSEDRAPVADVGCGPGHVAGYLHGLDVDVCGVDLSPRMCELARRLHPGIPFLEGSMLALPVAKGSWWGIVAFYAICHLPAPDVEAVAREFYRTLRRGGLLMLAFHAGDEVRHTDELLGVDVDLDFHFHRVGTAAAQLEAAGFSVDATLERRPYEPYEVATQRAYILARR